MMEYVKRDTLTEKHERDKERVGDQFDHFASTDYSFIHGFRDHNTLLQHTPSPLYSFFDERKCYEAKPDAQHSTPFTDQPFIDSLKLKDSNTNLEHAAVSINWTPLTPALIQSPAYEDAGHSGSLHDDADQYRSAVSTATFCNLGPVIGSGLAGGTVVIASALFTSIRSIFWDLGLEIGSLLAASTTISTATLCDLGPEIGSWLVAALVIISTLLSIVVVILFCSSLAPVIYAVLKRSGIWLKAIGSGIWSLLRWLAKFIIMVAIYSCRLIYAVATRSGIWLKAIGSGIWSLLRWLAKFINTMAISSRRLIYAVATRSGIWLKAIGSGIWSLLRWLAKFINTVAISSRGLIIYAVVKRSDIWLKGLDGIISVAFEFIYFIGWIIVAAVEQFGIWLQGGPPSGSQEESMTSARPLPNTQEESMTSAHPLPNTQEESMTSAHPLPNTQEESMTSARPLPNTQEESMTSARPLPNTQEESMTSARPLPNTQEESMTSARPLPNTQEESMTGAPPPSSIEEESTTNVPIPHYVRYTLNVVFENPVEAGSTTEHRPPPLGSGFSN